jgi:hypothetical protein
MVSCSGLLIDCDDDDDGVLVAIWGLAIIDEGGGVGALACLRSWSKTIKAMLPTSRSGAYDLDSHSNTFSFALFVM